MIQQDEKESVTAEAGDGKMEAEKIISWKQGRQGVSSTGRLNGFGRGSREKGLSGSTMGIKAGWTTPRKRPLRSEIGITA